MLERLLEDELGSIRLATLQAIAAQQLTSKLNNHIVRLASQDTDYDVRQLAATLIER